MLPVAVLGSFTCTGDVTTGFTPLNGANNCITRTITTIDVATSTFVDIPVPKYNSALGALRAIHLLNVQVDWTPSATMSTNADSQGFSILLNGGGGAIIFTSQADGLVLSTAVSASGEDLDSEVGKFRQVTNKVGPVYATFPVAANTHRGVNAVNLQWTDTTFQSTPLTVAASPVPVILDVGSFDRWTQRAVNVADSGDITIDDVSPIDADYESADGTGTWALRAALTTGFTVSGTPTNGATISVSITPHLFFCWCGSI